MMPCDEVTGDLVVLSGKPLTFDRATLNEIKIVETIKAGKSIYKRAIH
jgi:predicted amidohydrolase YtcJ